MRRIPCLFVLLCLGMVQSANAYDPLEISSHAKLQTLDLTMMDAPRQREIPLRIYLPPEDHPAKPAAVILFSHGLGGSREGSSFLGEHWAARGFVAVFVQHPGSDASVWRDVRIGQRMNALREAASGRNLLLRIQDIPAVLDQLDRWNSETQHPLAGRLDLKHVGMSGHSFGALTTQAVSGQASGLPGQKPVDPRIRAALILSPGIPRLGNPEQAFGDVKLPWLLMTGTQDNSPIGNQTPQSRREVYPALPAGDKYELVLDKAEHSVFTDRPLIGDRQQRNPNHHRAILAISTAFWDTYLNQNADARAWLSNDGPRSILETADQWQTK